MQHGVPDVGAIFPAYQEPVRRYGAEVLPEDRRVDVGQAGAGTRQVGEGRIGHIERRESLQDGAAARPGQEEGRVDGGGVGYVERRWRRNRTLTRPLPQGEGR